MITLPKMFRLSRRCCWLLGSLMLTLNLTALLKPDKVLGAERIALEYGLLQWSIPVDSLERFAEEGVVDRKLGFWVRWLDPETLSQLRQLLQQRIDESPAVVAQFTYMNLGEALLQRVGGLIQTDNHLNGFYSLRSALILAAADESEGLTLLNVVRRFPGHTVRINTPLALQLVNEWRSLASERESAVQAVIQQSEQAAVAENAAQNRSRNGSQNALETTSETPSEQHGSFSPLPDLRSPNLRQLGAYQVAEQAPQIPVSQRRYTPQGLVTAYSLDVDLYLPEVVQPEVTQPVPLVVVSHSLGSSRFDFRYLGMHLASHGIAVAVPEHLGSNRDYLQAFLQGEVQNLTEPDEYVSRKTDITALLDRLEQSTLPSWSGALDLQRVGIMGYSLGGTTALSLAGGGLNAPRLQQQCVQSEQISLNLSVLLQCLASQIPAAELEQNWYDARIQAAIAVYPPTSVVLGAEGMGKIAVPTLMVSASQDVMAPTVAEQIYPFLELTTPDKYLVLIDPATHFTLAPIGSEERLPNFLKGDGARVDPAIGQGYLQALSTAFFQVYLNNRSDYLPYLSPAYAQSMSQDELRLYLTQSLSLKESRRAN